MKGYRFFLLVCLFNFCCVPLNAQETGSLANEAAYYPITTLPIPDGVVLEVGGLTVLPDGRLAVSTRRGEIWIIQNAAMEGGRLPVFRRFAHGLHEVLGIAYTNGSFFVSQRGELTRLTDTDGDDRADEYKTVFVYPLSGNYHEYAFGPVLQPNGDMFVTLNLGMGEEGSSAVPWRGWTLVIKPDGTMQPFATGMRSPAGIGLDKEGELFYTDNQGNWISSGWLTHVQKGDFTGNTSGLRWAGLPSSPVKLKPGVIPNSGRPMFDVAKEIPGIKTPAVWFPHGIMGNSTSGILLHTGRANMGPFEGHLFVGDQSQSKVMRASLEKVKGVYQGACYPFRSGFASGVLRQDWGSDGSMFVGMTSRGWQSEGKELYALQRLSWNGKMPFEMQTVSAKPDGFEIRFTLPVNKNVAQNITIYSLASFTYKYHSDYGSPVINQKEHRVRAAVVSEDGLTVRLVTDSLRQGYIHEIKLGQIEAQDKTPLLHDVAYYTLNQIPDGERVMLAKLPIHKHHPAAPAPTKNESPTKETKLAAASSPVKKTKRMTKMPAEWGNTVDQTIMLGTKVGLQFDKTLLHAKAGSRVKLVFTNTDDMQHNFVLTAPGKGDEVGKLAIALGLKGPEKQYVPNTSLVFYHTKLLQPTTAETIYFNAPAQPGSYPFVCTYPGHYTIMKGILKVTK